MGALVRVTLAALVSLAATTVALAQDWPSRPIRFIVSQGAGSSPDLLCRLIAEHVSRRLGQQITIENRTGGAGIVAASAAAQAAPDGYTFFFATTAPLVTHPYTFKSLPYDPARAFTAVAMGGKGPFFVVVNPDVPAKTLPELLALAKADPNKISVATDGQRNFSGMVTAWISKLAGINLVQVPYATMPQGVQDTIGGRVQAAVMSIPVAVPHQQSGALRVLAVSSGTRMPGFETIPSIAETYPGFDFVGWFAVVAPVGTPANAIERLNKEWDAALREPDVIKRYRDMGVYGDSAGTPASTQAFIRSQYDDWGKVVREIGLQPE